MMALHAPNFGRASALPLSAVLASLPSYSRPVLERLVVRLIGHLDGLDGDPDDEADPFNEGEPLFDRVWREMVNCHQSPTTDPNHDAEAASWLERADQSASAYGNPTHAHFQNGEDCEDDDPAEAEPDAEPDNDGDCGEHGLDQRGICHWGGAWRAE